MITEVTGYVQHDDGTVHQFRLAAPAGDTYGWHQWGSDTRHHGAAVDLLDAAAAALNAQEATPPFPDAPTNPHVNAPWEAP
jgi:hypothetical protein